jgi:DNA invertase Pin-like site-specific DNA recombinase
MPRKTAQSDHPKPKAAASQKSSAKTSSGKISPAEKSPAKAVGYLRVSTGEQELEKNKADILRLANDLDLGKVHFTEEKISGKISWRKRKISEILDELAAGDAIIVSELSRLGRSMLECMEILSLALTKGINVYSVKGNWKLDNSIQSKIVAVVFSMAAEIERDLISQRTKEALRYKKEQGIKLGRPRGAGKSKLDAFRPEIKALLANGATQKFIAQRYGATEATVSNWIRKNHLKSGVKNSGE